MVMVLDLFVTRGISQQNTHTHTKKKNIFFLMNIYRDINFKSNLFIDIYYRCTKITVEPQFIYNRQEAYLHLKYLSIIFAYPFSSIIVY